MRRPNHGCASAVKTKTSPEPPETLAPQFDYWAPKSRISAAFTLTKAPKSGSWGRVGDLGTAVVIVAFDQIWRPLGEPPLSLVTLFAGIASRPLFTTDPKT